MGRGDRTEGRRIDGREKIGDDLRRGCPVFLGVIRPDCRQSYERKGVTIIPNNKDNDKMIKELEKALENISTPYLYVSIDVDVSSLNAVLAARFMEFIGVDEECLMDSVELIKRLLNSKKVELIGLDFTEIEVHFLNAKLKNGKIDKTLDLLDRFLTLVS